MLCWTIIDDMAREVLTTRTCLRLSEAQATLRLQSVDFDVNGPNVRTRHSTAGVNQISPPIEVRGLRHIMLIIRHQLPCKSFAADNEKRGLV